MSGAEPPGRGAAGRAKEPPAGGRRAERFRREAEALRANLRRRKEQARRRGPAPRRRGT